MKINYQIRNADVIAAAFRRAPSLMTKNFKTALQKSALLVERDSKIWITRMGAIDTGNLRSSIGVDTSPLSRLGIAIATGEKKLADYGVFVHEGLGSNRSYGRRPFLETALYDNDDKIQGYFVEAAQDALNSIGRAA